MEEKIFSSIYLPSFRVSLMNELCHLFPDKGWLSYNKAWLFGNKARLFGNKARLLKNTHRVFLITPRVFPITPKELIITPKVCGRQMEEKISSSIFNFKVFKQDLRYLWKMEEKTNKIICTKKLL